MMNTELTLNALQSMNAQEYEEIRAAGSDMRRNLTHEVMREVDAPANWMMNGEYGSEFGGFFPRPGSFHASPRTFPPGIMFAGRRFYSALDAGSGEWWWTASPSFRCNISSRLSRSVTRWRLPRHWMRRDIVLTTSSIS